MSSTPTESVEAPGAAVRLIVEYDGDRLTLVSQQQVSVAVTGFDLDQAQGLKPGPYAEVRDREGETLAYVPIRDAMSTSVEVFPEEPGGEITRTDVERATGAFTVVVPVAPTASEVAIIRVPPAPSTEAETGEPPGEIEFAPREDLATFPLEPLS
jgi:hypothetical protein